MPVPDRSAQPKLSVPKRFGERIARAIETGTPRGVIADRGLW
jgi:hypothetical protein